MAENYPILKVTSGVIPEMLQTTVSDLALRLIHSGTLSFAVRQVTDSRYLIDMENSLVASLGGASLDVGGGSLPKCIVGYNRNRVPLSLSPSHSDSGLAQLLDKNLVFFPNGVATHRFADGDEYSINPVQYFTAQNFIVIIQEFLEKGNELYLSLASRNPTHRTSPIHLTRINLDQLAGLVR